MISLLVLLPDIFLPDLREIRSNSEGVQFAFHSQHVSCSLDSTLYIIANIPQLPVSFITLLCSLTLIQQCNGSVYTREGRAV